MEMSEDRKSNFVDPESTNIKQFVEVSSGEIIYMKENGELFYQAERGSSIIKIQELKQILKKDSPVQIQNQRHAMSFPVPIVPIHKKYDNIIQQ